MARRWGECEPPKTSAQAAKREWGRRTTEWRPENLLLVDGISCPYTMTDEGIMVHLPGRISVILSVLRKKHHIIEPKVWRVTVFNRDDKGN